MNLMITDDALRVIPQADPTAAPSEVLSYGIADSTLGKVLLARSADGVCAILLGDSVPELVTDLAGRFPQAMLVPSEGAVKEDLAKVRRYIDQPAAGLHLVLDMRGTPFQRRVWEKLRSIPAGRTASYMELARWISPLANPRAVASACAANPIALAVPCHRIIGSNGDLTGYRWGIERKRALIQKEATA